ncbi:hypothetical protein AMS68_000172 [Peltaster fructicola]|uniref:Peptidase S26 domain-containing protein n=1 Tax=Peltaster fructicola TaxID=286661 RepID=A0A6H0XJ51_9PEZI|nr:hypothetical protein AMS68_000172 [Peltaster fructicola]
MLRSLATRPVWKSITVAERGAVFARLRSTVQQNRAPPPPKNRIVQASQPRPESSTQSRVDSKPPVSTITRTSRSNGWRDKAGLGLYVLGLMTGVYILLHSFWAHFYEFSWAYGISMLPTINSCGDKLIISKWYRRGRGIHLGDIVSYTHPINSNQDAVKRVLGMPGDFVLRDTPGEGEGHMIQVPAGHCWVVGDNVRHSRDSRHFGPLPLALVTGKIVGVLEPTKFPFIKALSDGTTSD